MRRRSRSGKYSAGISYQGHPTLLRGFANRLHVRLSSYAELQLQLTAAQFGASHRLQTHIIWLGLRVDVHPQPLPVVDGVWTSDWTDIEVPQQACQNQAHLGVCQVLTDALRRAITEWLEGRFLIGSERSRLFGIEPSFGSEFVRVGKVLCRPEGRPLRDDNIGLQVKSAVCACCPPRAPYTAWKPVTANKVTTLWHNTRCAGSNWRSHPQPLLNHGIQVKRLL